MNEDETKVVQIKFPRGFLWGAASSAYQTEGDNRNADWWAWEHSPQRMQDLQTHEHPLQQYMSDIACDSYNRFEDDLDLAQSLNLNSIRLGIEWSRIEPKQGEFNDQELEHYEQVFRAARKRGLKIFLTLHHFTLPQWFAQKGAFTKRQNVKYFVDYVEVVARRLGEYVDFWLTINEPEVYATHSYVLGVFPPQLKSWPTAFRVVKNLIAAHNQIASMLRFITAKPVGMAYQLSDLQPAGFFGGVTRWFLDYIANKYILRRTIANCDFIGVNYYNHYHIGFFGRRKHSLSNHLMSDVGWGIHADGLERVLLGLAAYKKPIYITENGIADAADQKREQFIKDHLYYVQRALAQGVDIRGYIYWSLTDNFEWQHGFWPRFGLVEIEREHNLTRKVRASAKAFAEIAKNNGFSYKIKN